MNYIIKILLSFSSLKSQRSQHNNKYIPIYLSSQKEISSNAFDAGHERVIEKQDVFNENNVKVIKSQTVFSLADVIECIDALLYFSYPISQDEQSENASKTFEMIKDMEVEAEFKEFPVSPYEQIWIDMNESYRSKFH